MPDLFFEELLVGRELGDHALQAPRLFGFDRDLASLELRLAAGQEADAIRRCYDSVRA